MPYREGETRRPQQREQTDHDRRVQKSDRINSDRQSGSDQLGSTRIMKKKPIKLKKTETFTHLKAKIPVNNGPNKERLATFLLVQSLNSPFFPPPIGAEPGRAKRESRITCTRMLRTNQSKTTRVHTTLLASMCRAMPFSDRALKKKTHFL